MIRITSGRTGPPLHVRVTIPTSRPALDAALDGDSILVGPGLWSGVGNVNLDFQGKAVALIGELGPEVTILSGQDGIYDRALYFISGEGPGSRLEGFTLEDYRTSSFLGAVNCDNGASPALSNLIFDHCGNVGSAMVGRSRSP